MDEENLVEGVITQARKDRDKFTKQRLNIPVKRKLRNLVQYKDLSDEEFDELFAQKQLGISQNKEFEERIQRKIKEFGVDYSLDDLNSNDKLVLRALAQAMINLEDLELETYNVRQAGITIDNILLLEKISKMMTDLRSDISKLQDDLSITRKVRKSSQEESAKAYLETLKQKAKEFYESKMQLVFCPKCHTWIGSVWALYATDPRNRVSFVCNRDMGDGNKCGEKITIGVDELIKRGGSNKADIPESIK